MSDIVGIVAFRIYRYFHSVLEIISFERRIKTLAKCLTQLRSVSRVGLVPPEHLSLQSPETVKDAMYSPACQFWGHPPEALARTCMKNTYLLKLISVPLFDNLLFQDTLARDITKEKNLK